MIASSFLNAQVHAGRRAQHLVDVGLGHAVGDERDLQVPLGAVAHGALARHLLAVEEVGPAGRGTLQLVAVVGEHEVVDDRADAWPCTVPGRWPPPAILATSNFRTAFVAARFEFVGFHHHVPGVAAALDLRAQHAKAAVHRLRR
ncbi:MAG: hypothetical protein U1F49_04575 [Rubrivivax sp.]